MGVSITRYKCDLDGVCRVLREGEMEWLPLNTFKPEKWMLEVVSDWHEIDVPADVDMTNPEEFYNYFASLDASEYAGVNPADYVDFVHTFSTWISDPFAQDAIKFAMFLFKGGS